MVRDEVMTALSEVLYVDESDLFDGDATDLRDLGLDSVRFVLLMRKFGVDRQSEQPMRFAETLSVEAWTHELEELRRG